MLNTCSTKKIKKLGSENLYFFFLSIILEFDLITQVGNDYTGPVHIKFLLLQVVKIVIRRRGSKNIDNLQGPGGCIPGLVFPITH